MRVPIFKEERFSSIPLAGGSAEPYDPNDTQYTVNIVKRINGQHLEGEMIPKREKSAKAFNTRYSMKVHTKVPTKVPLVISTTSTIYDETIPLLAEGEEDIEPQTMYGAVDTKESQVMKELSFDLIV
jgi:hypothetical protein